SAGSLYVTVTQLPGAATVTGDNSVCQNDSESYSASASNATSYNWTVPSGWTINSGQGTSSISVTVGSSSGNVSATPSNSCGSGSAGSLYVTVTQLPGAATVNGNVVPNEGSDEEYTTSALNATSYNWTVPSGWSINSGNGTSSIFVTVGSTSGNVCAKPSNSCGDGVEGCLAVTVQPVGITRYSNNQAVKIYPNPTAGKLVIECTFKIGVVEIFSILGEKVFIKENTSIIDISHLLPGTYIARIIDNEGKFLVVKRLIKN
ncbi:MAG: T9SS type A sorting domain-containing protein, partial [Bacteroidetes bacterium]|nr:T9SS type A sorting domain-containing protein [Bacteroidota bacterium]